MSTNNCKYYWGQVRDPVHHPARDLVHHLAPKKRGLASRTKSLWWKSFALVSFWKRRLSPDSTFAFADNETETLFPRKGSSDKSGSYTDRKYDYARNRIRGETTPRGRGSLWTPHRQMEPQDEAVHLWPTQRNLYHRSLPHGRAGPESS